MLKALKAWWLRAWLGLCLCLVLAQTLGLTHRVVHVHTGLAATHVSEAGVGLWGEHRQATDCQLFDQHCADGPSPTWALPSWVPPMAAWASAWPLTHIVQVVRGYAARGPPCL